MARVPVDDRQSWYMLGETALIGLGLAVLSLSLPHPWGVLPAVLQGFWFQRLYCIGHEGSHRTLLSDRVQNDVMGQVALLPLMVPLPVFRKIHVFHHGHNRRDADTSALDTFRVPQDAGPLRRAAPWLLWFAGIAAGGWFVHSLVSIVLFLLLPVSVARRVSPAFRGWNLRYQLGSIGLFSLGLALHLLAAAAQVWWLTLGLPMLVFAWVYSAQLYVYHYGTTRGPQVRFHVRSLQGFGVSWWLLQLNEHATHHQRPDIPWHARVQHRVPLPPEFAHNQDVHTFVGGLLHQLRGPTLLRPGDEP